MSEDNVAQELPEMPAVPETATLVDPPKSKVSKIDLKRQKIFQDRMKRFLAKGLTVEQAVDAIQREDYDRLPPDAKIKKLEGALIGNFQQIARDITLLKQNEDSLADVMDVNFRAFGKMLSKLGLSVEDQQAIFKEAETEFKAEREAAAAAAKAEAENPPAEPAVSEG